MLLVEVQGQFELLTIHLVNEGGRYFLGDRFHFPLDGQVEQELEDGFHSDECSIEHIISKTC